MEVNYQELTTQLWDLLTKEEIELGIIYIEYEVDILTSVKLDSNMVDKVMNKSPYRDHILGFKRRLNCIALALDEEGQSMWNEAERRKAEWIKKYGD